MNTLKKIVEFIRTKLGSAMAKIYLLKNSILLQQQNYLIRLKT